MNISLIARFINMSITLINLIVIILIIRRQVFILSIYYLGENARHFEQMLNVYVIFKLLSDM
jgi:hypothetical protein